MRRIRNYPVGAILEVKWLDIVQDPDWQDDKKALERPKADCTSYGVYRKQDKEFLYLSSTISNWGEQDKLTIPLGAIKPDGIRVLIPVPPEIFKTTRQKKVQKSKKKEN